MFPGVAKAAGEVQKELLTADSNAQYDQLIEINLDTVSIQPHVYSSVSRHMLSLLVLYCLPLYIIATAGSLRGLHCETIILIRLLAN